MKVPIEISFRNLDSDPQIESLIREKAERLERFCGHLSSCRVAVERMPRRSKEGNDFHVRIDMTVPPSHELAVSKDPTGKAKRNDLAMVIRRAFAAAEKQLKALVDKQQGEVKRHLEQDVEGVVVRLFREQGYGFLRDSLGRELYFHRNSMLEGDWERVEIGAGVNFFEHEDEGEHGPQASTVRIVDKPGVRAAKVDTPQVEPPLGWEVRPSRGGN
jgi:hypothetical protein